LLLMGQNSCMPNADAVIKDAQKSYWQDSKNRKNVRGHFVRRSANIRSYAEGSYVLDNMIRKPAKLPFMK